MDFKEVLIPRIQCRYLAEMILCCLCNPGVIYLEMPQTKFPDRQMSSHKYCVPVRIE